MIVGATKGVYDEDFYRRRNVPLNLRKNNLLIRKEIGRVRRTTYDLPQPAFIYGKSNRSDAVGAAETVGNWNYGNPASPSAMDARKDFIKMNKFASSSGCITAKNVAAFRRTTDFRIGEMRYPKPGLDKTRSFFPNKDTVFGKPGERNANMANIMNNHYQRKYIEERRVLQRETALNIQKMNLKSSSFKHTKASLGHTKVAHPPAEKLFKLKKYDSVKSRINFKRSQTAPAVRNVRKDVTLMAPVRPQAVVEV